MKYTRAQLLEYERLFNEWSAAEKVAHDAAMAIVEDELAGRPIEQSCREEVMRLVKEARKLMIEALKNAPPTVRG